MLAGLTIVNDIQRGTIGVDHSDSVLPFFFGPRAGPGEC